MIFAFLLSFIQSYQVFSYPILTLTDDNFPTIIDKRPPGSSYFVMFHGDHCPACRMTYPILIKAAKKSAGLVNFCHVDCSRNPHLAGRFRIMSIPTFIIFHDGGSYIYNSQRTPHDFIVAAAKYIPDKTEKLDKSNISEFKNGVIMFNDKKKVPAIWRGISANLTQRGVRVGYSIDKDLISEFESDETHFIVYIDSNGNREELAFSSNYSDIYSNIAEKFEITPAPTPVPKSEAKPKSKPTTQNDPKIISTISDFNSACKGSSKICVIEMAENPSEKFLAVKKEFQKQRFVFLNCKSPEIFGEMNKGLYIFHPKKDMFIFSDDFDALSENLERVADGSAKWSKMKKIESEL